MTVTLLAAISTRTEPIVVAQRSLEALTISQ